MPAYDVIVLGAGAMGTAAAYYLAKRGANVLLLEQFELDHRWGSSYGQSRIIRYSYNVVDYIALAKPNYELWQALQQEAEETLFIRTGGVDFGRADDASLNATQESMQAMDITHDVLTAEEANRRFPQFTFSESSSDEMRVLYQADSGMLVASQCVLAHARLAERHGATIKTYEPATRIDVQDDSVTVITEGDRYTAAKLVVTAGGWAAELLKNTGLELPFEVLRCQLAYFTPHEQPAAHDVSQMPVFIFHRDGDMTKAMYGLPSYQGGGVKAAFHHGPAHTHPREIDYTPDADNVQAVREAIGPYIPAVKHGELASSRVCLYTQTPDGHFVIDTHPAHSHVIIGGGFSGHGFKFSTIIGKILSDLTLDGQTPHNISLFKADRF